jgi:hypothetical protein
MKLTRSVLALAMVASVGGCITEPKPIGNNGGSTGTFSITIPEFANGPTNGKATFQLERVESAATLTLSFVDSLGFSTLISGPGAPVAGDDRAIGEEEGLIEGVLIRRVGTTAETYVLTAGTLSIDGVSATRLVGTIEFTAVQRDGPAIGTVIHGSGNFTASGGNSQI